MKSWRGYVFSRAINNNHIPQRVQNLVIRDYCQKNEAQFLLSATEYYMDDCYMMLKSQMNDTNGFDGLVFYSLHMLPLDKGIRLNIVDKLLESGKELHFALESLSIKKGFDISLIEDILLTKEVSRTIGIELKGELI
jgi:sporadic carbohydrate cluster protein (TIGR04323 family)